MSLIVAGRFTTFPAAEDAAQHLFDHGFVEEDVTLFFVNPRGQHARHAHAATALSTATTVRSRMHHGATIGAVAGAVIGVAIFMSFSASLPVAVIAAGVGAYIGSWAGATLQAGQREAMPHERVHREFRNSGVLVAVHVSEGNQQMAAAVLRDAGADDIERATGRWQQGKWADFDPTMTPTPFAEMTQQHA
jgi:hypothetical protein